MFGRLRGGDSGLDEGFLFYFDIFGAIVYDMLEAVGDVLAVEL